MESKASGETELSTSPKSMLTIAGLPILEERDEGSFARPLPRLTSQVYWGVDTAFTVFLLIFPPLLTLGDLSGMAFWICMIAGIAHLPLNLITSWGPRAPGFTGLHLLPMWGHSMVDVTVHACYAACFFLNEDQGMGETTRLIFYFYVPVAVPLFLVMGPGAEAVSSASPPDKKFK